MRFGAELNAYTSFDETSIYARSAIGQRRISKKGLLVLHDWANAVSYEDKKLLTKEALF
jgi:zinc protease